MSKADLVGLRRDLYFHLMDVPDEKVDCFCRVLEEDGIESACQLFLHSDLEKTLASLHDLHRTMLGGEEHSAAVATKQAVEMQWLLWKDRGHQPGI